MTDDLVLVPGLNAGVDADDVRRILDGLLSGAYRPDTDRPDRDGGDERVLRTHVPGLPTLALSRGSDDDGGLSIEHAVLCLSRPLGTEEDRMRAKAAMRAILRTVGPASPHHPSMLCRTAAPWCGLVIQSFASSSDETDLDVGDLADVLPPIAMVKSSGLPTGEACVKLSSMWDAAMTDAIMSIDPMETLRLLADLRRRPLGPGKPTR